METIKNYLNEKEIAFNSYETIGGEEFLVIFEEQNNIVNYIERYHSDNVAWFDNYPTGAITLKPKE